jgi:hypothetical protein
LRAEAARELGVAAEDAAVEEVLGNTEAMRWAVTSLARAKAVTVEGVLVVHRRLHEGTRLQEACVGSRRTAVSGVRDGGA